MVAIWFLERQRARLVVLFDPTAVLPTSDLVSAVPQRPGSLRDALKNERLQVPLAGVDGDALVVGHDQFPSIRFQHFPQLTRDSSAQCGCLSSVVGELASQRSSRLRVIRCVLII